MEPTYRMNWLLPTVMGMALVASANTQATTPTSDYQTWVPVNINAKLSNQLRGFLEFQQRIGNDSSNLTTTMIRPALGGQLIHRRHYGLVI
jgi:hypothetical protein